MNIYRKYNIQILSVVLCQRLQRLRIKLGSHALQHNLPFTIGYCNIKFEFLYKHAAQRKLIKFYIFEHQYFDYIKYKK